MLEHDRTEPHDSAHSKAQAERGYRPGADNQLKTPATAVPQPGAKPSSTSKAGDSPIDVEAEDEDDGKFDIDDISSQSPTSTLVGEPGQKPAPLMYGPSGEALTFPERHQAAPTIRSPPQSGFSFDGPKSPNEHDLSHSSAQHLRQYATYPREGSNGGHSARDRTPRGSESTRTSASQSSASDNARPRSRSSIKRSHRVHNRHNTDRVKAFVVFGADSSDLDSSTSADESDDTAVRQAQQP